MSLKLIGAHISPFVRKIRVALAEKNLSYEHDPMVPFGVSDEYKKMNPLGKIPVLTDGNKVIPDSSAICVYLDKIQPEPSFYSEDAYELARILWFEEFADAGFISPLLVVFQQRVLGPVFLKSGPADEDVVKASLTEALPPLMDYLEVELGDNEYLVGNRFTVADLATACPFVNFHHGGEKLDAKRWPKVAAYVDRILSRPSFKAIIEEEEGMLKAMRG